MSAKWLAAGVLPAALGGWWLVAHGGHVIQTVRDALVKSAWDTLPEMLQNSDAIGRFTLAIALRDAPAIAWYAATGATVVGVVAVIAAIPGPGAKLAEARAVNTRVNGNPWRRFARPAPGAGAARWACNSDVRELLRPPRRTVGSRVILGAWGKQTLCVYPGRDGKPEGDHVLIAGPSASGKGLTVKPTLLDWRGSVICNDPQGDYFADCAGALEAAGVRCHVIGPGIGSRYDPFIDVFAGGDLAIENAALELAGVGRDADSIFAERASIAISALLHAARSLEVAALPLLRDALTGGVTGMQAVITHSGDREALRKFRMFLGGATTDDRFLGSTVGTLVTRLEPIFSPEIIAMCSASDVCAAHLRAAPTALFLQFPRSSVRAILPIWRIINDALIGALDRTGGHDRAQRPTLWVLDELAEYRPARLETHISNVRKSGIVVLIAVQDVGQITAAYGSEHAETIRNACAATVFFRPRNPALAAPISEHIGTATTYSITTDSNGRESARPDTQSLISPQAINLMARDQIIITAEGLPPIAAARAWPDHPALSQHWLRSVVRVDGRKQVWFTPRVSAPKVRRYRVSRDADTSASLEKNSVTDQKTKFSNFDIDDFDLI